MLSDPMKNFLSASSSLSANVAMASLFASFILSGCQARTAPQNDSQLTALIAKTRDQMVSVKGGTFQMGDFGEMHSADKLPYSHDRDDGPLHTVQLSDFSIAKYKVTLGDYDIYAAANGLPLPYTGDAANGGDVNMRAQPKSATFPVGVDWQDAQSYCRWLGKQAGLPMDLPTEAEWEYAARARGTSMIFATDNGQEEPGRNYPSYKDTEKIRGNGTGELPVGLYPPNPLGLYDLGNNGFEWTNDWYGEDYYSRSPAIDPKGPESGVKKVIRSRSNGSNAAMTFQRGARETALVNSPGNFTNRSYGFRCVAHQAVR
jgi:formylglycine-generating enzyme required for sulfatase activity